MRRTSIALLGIAIACSGVIGDPSGDDPPEVEIPELPSGDVLPPTGITRLSALEYDRSLEILLEDTARPARAILPEDARTPFDNDYESQRASQALVEGAELLALEAAQRLLAEPERRDRIVGCTPSGVDDATCMRSFVEGFLRLAYRREASDADINFFVQGAGEWPGAMAVASSFDDFYEGVSSVVQIVLQDPEFLFRVEVGSPDPETEGVHRLDDFEIATRLAFFIWGAIPDRALLDRAAAGELSDPDARLDEAMRLFDSPRAQERFALFHAMWFGYEKLLGGDELGTAMRTETRALMDRVLFEDGGPWQDLFRYEETFVDSVLAANYDLPAPADGSAWVPYERAERRGLFAHGSFLAHGAQDGDTSPVFRGLAIQTRAFCRDIPPPPPGVNTDEGPDSDALCKPERYAAHATGGCANCHQYIDGIGFGLENFDATGAYRDIERDNPDTTGDESTCRIEGEGYLTMDDDSQRSFRGPAQLAEIGLETGALRDCFVTHLHRLTIGRGEVRTADGQAIEQLGARLPEGDFTLRDAIRSVVGSDVFVLRREETL